MERLCARAKGSLNIFTQTHCLSVFVFVTTVHCAKVLILYEMGWIRGTERIKVFCYRCWNFSGTSSSSIRKISKVLQQHPVATHI